jgi:hypothetical protein
MKTFGAEVSGCRILWVVLWGCEQRYIIGQPWARAEQLAPWAIPTASPSSGWPSVGLQQLGIGKRMGVAGAGRINYEGPRLVKMASSTLTEWQVAAS